MTAISSSVAHSSLVALPAPQVLDIVGADAVSFAQAQFSSNLGELANGQWQWSAWLSAQGRVRAFFHLLRDDDQHLRLVLRGGSAAALRDALQRYVFRAKVQLHAPEGLAAWIEWLPMIANENPESRLAHTFERSAGETRIVLPGTKPRRLIIGHTGALPLSIDSAEASANENDLADIDAGLITLDASLEDKLLPAWIGLDALGAASTNKGCYPGQEIVARMHFKGGNKRWLHRLAFSAEHLPRPGTPLGSEGDDTGLIISAAWSGAHTGAALAVLGERNDSGSSGLNSPTITIGEIRKSFNKV